MIRLDFDEVKGLFLAERRGGLARCWPVADGERRAFGFGAEDRPIISNANGGFRLGVGGIAWPARNCAGLAPDQPRRLTTASFLRRVSSLQHSYAVTRQKEQAVLPR